jgi:hypothetical protein
LEPPPINIYKTDEELDLELRKAQDYIDAHPSYDSTYAKKNIKVLKANNEMGVLRLRIETSPMYTIWTGRLYKQKRENEQTYGFRGNGFKVTYKNNDAKVSLPILSPKDVSKCTPPFWCCIGF